MVVTGAVLGADGAGTGGGMTTGAAGGLTASCSIGVLLTSGSGAGADGEGAAILLVPPPHADKLIATAAASPMTLMIRTPYR